MSDVNYMDKLPAELIDEICKHVVTNETIDVCDLYKPSCIGALFASGRLRYAALGTIARHSAIRFTFDVSDQLKEADNSQRERLLRKSIDRWTSDIDSKLSLFLPQDQPRNIVFRFGLDRDDMPSGLFKALTAFYHIILQHRRRIVPTGATRVSTLPENFPPQTCMAEWSIPQPVGTHCLLVWLQSYFWEFQAFIPKLSVAVEFGCMKDKPRLQRLESSGFRRYPGLGQRTDQIFVAEYIKLAMGTALLDFEAEAIAEAIVTATEVDEKRKQEFIAACNQLKRHLVELKRFKQAFAKSQPQSPSILRVS